MRSRHEESSQRPVRRERLADGRGERDVQQPRDHEVLEHAGAGEWVCGRGVSGRLASAEKHGCEQPLFHGAGVRGRGEGEGPVPPEVQLLALPVLSEARVPASAPEYTENGAMRSRFLLDVRYDLSSLYIIRCEEGLLVFVVFLPILPIPEKNTDLRKCISQRLQIKQIVENGD